MRIAETGPLDRKGSHREKHVLHRVALIALCMASIAASAASVSYDRAWWNATDTDQRTQFLAGYLDCATNDLGKKALDNAQWYAIEPEITRYYSTRIETADRVPSLLLRFGSGRPSSTDPAPEVHPGLHGFFDGTYWYQATPAGRIGFVQGYLECYTSLPEHHAFTNHAADWYVRKLDDYFCADDLNCVELRDEEKIAIVLHRLQPEGASQP